MFTGRPDFSPYSSQQILVCAAAQPRLAGDDRRRRLQSAGCRRSQAGGGHHEIRGTSASKSRGTAEIGLAHRSRPGPRQEGLAPDPWPSSSRGIEAPFERVEEISHLAAVLRREGGPAEALAGDGGGVAAVGGHEEVVGVAQKLAVGDLPDEPALPVAGSPGADAGRQPCGSSP